MAFINGNIPIVTNGLVYALDFGNSRTYNTGTKFNSLCFPNTVGSLVFPAGVQNESLIFSSSNAAATASYTFPVLNSTSSFTIQWVSVPQNTTPKFFLNQELSKAETLYTKISTSSIALSLYNKQRSGFDGRLFNYSQSRKNLYTWTYDQGSHLFYVNGFPVTASSNIVSTSSNDIGTNDFFSFNGVFVDLSGSTFFQDSQWSGSLDQLYMYNRSLTYNDVYQNYLVAATRYKLPAVPKLAVDPNTYLYVTATNITDTNTISAIDTFVTGLKTNNIWNKIALSYPLLGLANASQSVNLKDSGIFKLAFNNSWSFASSGSVPSSSTAFISSSFSPVSTNNFSYPNLRLDNSHFTYLSYDLITTSSNLFGVSRPATISGGQVFYSGSNAYHVFTASGDLLVDTTISASMLLVAGGGGGNSVVSAGGGGAGGLITASIVITPGSYPVTVGAGGLGAADRNSILYNGQNSTLLNYIAIGGGRGGSDYSIYAANGLQGGSGGGGAFGGSGIAGQGNAGASSYGGGGGSSTTGSGKNGGSGSYIPEYATIGAGYGMPLGWFAGGGGAGVFVGNTYGTGGPGGGGSGSDGNTVAQNGFANTGGGGGGAGYNSGDRQAGSGGSGIVIISYNTSSLLALTSSFTAFLSDTVLSGSHNSVTSSAMSAAANVGLITLSRTGSTTSQLYRNTTLVSNTSTVTATPISSIYVNAVNSNATASMISPYSVSYISLGLGLNASELSTYHSLISQLQTNLKRQNTLLDTYTGAELAHSLRRVGPSGYSGPAIRVQRSSDNTLKDIGFTSDGQLDTVGLLDFVGTGSGIVSTWYDQSGNGRNFAASGTPLIVISGSIVTVKNKPSVYLNGSSGFSTFGAPYLANTPITIFNYQQLWLNDNAQRYYFITTLGTSGALIIGFAPSDNWLLASWGYQDGGIIGNTQTLNPNLLTGIYTSPGSLFYKDGQLVGTNTTTPPVNMFTNSQPYAELRLGGWWGGYDYPGIVSENIIYARNLTSTRAAIDSNILSYYATGSDTDYRSFITATGITQPTQSQALETLVSDLKSYGLWNKMKAIYPMITDKYNLYSNTENLSTGWLTSNSTVTASNAAGPFTASLVANRLNDSISTPVTLTVTNNGASAYTIDGSDNPTLSLEKGRTYNFSISATGHPFYIMTGSGAYSAGGQYNTGVTGQGTQVGTLTFTVPDNAPSTLAYVCQFHASMGGTINIVENTDQHYIYQTVALTSGSAYVMSTHALWNGRDYIVLNPDGNSKTWFDIRNGFVSSSQGTVATASITRVSGTASNPSGSWYRCAMVFTSSVSTPYNTSIQLATTDGDLTYGSLTGLSGSFLWGAQFEPGTFISPYLSNNTGTAFTTSSIFDQMKYNLKDPRNTDSAFRITFSGSWTPAYSGLKGDGAVGTYAATKVNLTVRDLAMNSGSFSIYNRSNTVGSFGMYGNLNVTNTRFGWDGSNFKAEYGGPYLAVGTTDSYPGNIRGLLTVNRNLNRTTGFVRTQKYIDYTYGNPDGTVVSNDVAAGGGGGFSFGIYYNGTLYDLGGGGFGRNTWEQAFATFAGVPLSDYESKALYWIVQKYQTTLGRQVY